jgi:hypothetical protein
VIGYFILGVCLLAALLIFGQRLVNADPRKLARAVRIILAGVFGAAAAFFLLTGRFVWGLPLALLAAGFARRSFYPSGGGWFPGGGGATPGQTSDVETKYLRMTLQHDTGEMRGTVLHGRFAGRDLAGLDRDDLIELLGECHREDPESAQLLETWLDRTQGPDWREAGAQSQRSAATGGSMSREEACEVLGVSPDATAEEIREAHRRLMLKMHPDTGGSDYLAAKINQAKDVLLRR